MKTILRVLIDTDGIHCGARCRFLDSVVESCTLFGPLEYTQSNRLARPQACVKAGVDARPADLRNSVKGRGQLVRTRRG